jgi:beta-glucanase (GH16 family)
MTLPSIAVPYIQHSRPSTLVWEDDFDGSVGAAPDPAKWFVQDNAGNNDEALKLAANAVLDGDSHLAITARKESVGGYSYTSGLVATKTWGVSTALVSFLYGKVEARINVPAGQGIWPSFWTLGTDDSLSWPNNGEVDIMEMKGQLPTQNISAIHGGPTPWFVTSPINIAWLGGAALAGEFHNYGMIWYPNSIEFTLDGVVYARKTPANMPAGQTWPFTESQYFLLGVYVGSTYPGEPDGTTPFPCTMLVDWVRVYQ